MSFSTTKRLYRHSTIIASIVVALCVLAVVPAVYADRPDWTFIQKAGTANNDEIALSKLAWKQTSNPAIKKFAARMVKDHTGAGAQLASIATSMGIEPPSGIDAKHQIIETNLSDLTGWAFDKAYIGVMVTDHQGAKRLFAWGASNTHAPQLRQFAADTLPVVEDHLRMARSIKRSMENGTYVLHPAMGM